MHLEDVLYLEREEPNKDFHTVLEISSGLSCQNFDNYTQLLVYMYSSPAWYFQVVVQRWHAQEEHIILHVNTDIFEWPYMWTQQPELE